MNQPDHNRRWELEHNRQWGAAVHAARVRPLTGKTVLDSGTCLHIDAELDRLRAEVEALRKDAERWRYVVTHAEWIRRDSHDGRYSLMAVRLPYEADQSCVATRTAAIDAAKTPAQRGWVDCGECPRISTGCPAGACAKQAAIDAAKGGGNG